MAQDTSASCNTVNIECCSLFRKTHYGVFRSTISGRLLAVNQALVKMLGYNNKEELLSLNFFYDIHLQPDDNPSPGKDSVAYISSLTKKDNSVIWAEIEIWLINDDDNETQYLEGLVREITERKQYVEALYETKEKLKTTLHSIGDGVIVTDIKGRVTMLNDVATRLTGWPQKEAQGFMLTDIFKIINEYSRKPVKNPVKKVLTTGKIEGMANHTVLITRDGTEIPIADSAAPIKTRAGEMFGVIMVFRDVSEKRHLVKNLEKNRNLYRSVFENTGTATAIVEKDYTISMVNKKMEIMTGYTEEELEGKMKYIDFFVEDDKNKMKEYHRLRRNPETKIIPPNTYETQFLDRTGKKKDVLMTVDVIPDTKRSVISILDITDRKKSEKRARYLAYHDEVSGLFNRSFVEESLERLNTDRQLPISIIMGDINGLKLVNDAFGHQKGDQLLKKVGDILTNSCRHEDIIARWGGDEFIILLPQTQARDAKKIVERIRESCLSDDDEMIQPSIALGFSIKESEDQDLWRVLNEAEGWMYKRKLVESQSVRRSIIASLENTLLEKDYETKEHAERLKQMAIKLGNTIGLADNKLDDINLLATLHDIGKIAIPNSVLLKPASFTEEEWDTMKKHSVIGYRIAKSTTELASIAKEILHHHEWWNGEGYPQGLEGEEIPLLSRIIAVVDAYDVMTHERPYKAAMSEQEAIAELKKYAGVQFDPELVRIFIYEVILDPPFQ